MHPREASHVRVRVHVDGTVQGVGFRPYVHRLATAAALTGRVGNDAQGVFVEVQGEAAAVDRFVDDLPARAPALARVDGIRVEALPTIEEDGFLIVASVDGGAHDVLVAPDSATCDDCLAELWDASDRRHRYPFTNCTDCGPRYTIVTDVPYDRPNTTMAGFALCAACEAEYHDPSDRRFHAQPVCCPACGPRLRLVDARGHGVAAGDPIEAAAERLRAGAVVAVKGLGGYHLAVDATDEAAVARLRSRKHREDRPFALMVADLGAARSLCRLSAEEEALLVAPERPIVLARAREGADVAAAVAPETAWLGIMLAYTPLHHLLCRAVGRPLVMTSGNLSDEPIAHRDDDAFSRLPGLADLFLTHDRPIHTRVDDSVVRVVDGAPVPVRRSRGYVPRPVALPVTAPEHVLAVGAELKNTVCLARADRAFLSHHVGDLENAETLAAFHHAIDHVGRLFDVRPTVVAHDLHPEYLSTKHAIEMAELDPSLRLVGVQHHHAHVASCLADNGLDDVVIGVALDGLGYGQDGTLWGGEVLVADLREARRLAHLDLVPMPGGAAAVRAPWRMAVAHLDAAGLDVAASAVASRHPDRWRPVLQMARGGTNAPLTSSMGRLFDAVAALAGLHDTVTHEGQAAIALEQVADARETGSYPVGWSLEPGEDPGVPGRLRGADLVRAVVADLAGGAPPATVAARFHNAVVDLVVDACRRVRDLEGLGRVALSGGVFQNVWLLEGVASRLRGDGFAVLTHRQVPCNDGGISLGQAAVAAARLRADPRTSS